MYNKSKRVVVTGLGTVTPYGVGAQIFWDNIKQGKSCIIAELSAIECFCLYFIVEQHNKIAVLIFTNTEKQLESGRLFTGIFIEQIRYTGYLLLHDEAGMIFAELIDRFCYK